MNTKTWFSSTTLACAVATASCLIAGCASEQTMSTAARGRSDRAKVDLEAQPVCCERLADIRYTMLSTARTSLDMQPTDALVRTFDTGRSYFLAVEMPDAQGPRVVGLRTDLLGGARATFATVFVPSVMMLDRDFRQIGTVGELSLCFDRGWTRADVGYFSRLVVDAANVRYLLFFTDRTRLSGSVPYSSSATTAGAGVTIKETFNYQFPRSPDGHLDVWMDAPTAAQPSSLPACTRQ